MEDSLSWELWYAWPAPLWHRFGELWHRCSPYSKRHFHWCQGFWLDVQRSPLLRPESALWWMSYTISHDGTISSLQNGGSFCIHGSSLDCFNGCFPARLWVFPTRSNEEFYLIRLTGTVKSTTLKRATSLDFLHYMCFAAKKRINSLKK